MNIYIGNLHEQVKESQVRDLFSKFGSIVNINVITDMETGLTKGFGFVEMNEANDGRKAISELNGQEFMGNALEVEEAKPRPQSANKFMLDARKTKEDKQNSFRKR